jgi:serine/threonine protein kinase
MVGTSVKHYKILRLLGQGGMGEVYEAEDTKLGRRVALKVLPQHFAAVGDRRERFEREARTVAALNHPAIVTIHSVEEIDGLPFLTMELVDGKILGDLISARGMPLDRFLKIATPLADAVAAAHQQGVLHRDLKPANVMVTGEGRVKVLDFGLAKFKEEMNAAKAGVMPTRELTGEGKVLGTVAYMSPEQAEAKPIDQRSDIFSLGVVIYEMATGERPFKGDTSMSVISSILRDGPRSVTDVRPDLPRELARIIKRALAKDPERLRERDTSRNRRKSRRVPDIATGSRASRGRVTANWSSHRPRAAITDIWALDPNTGDAASSPRRPRPTKGPRSRRMAD